MSTVIEKDLSFLWPPFADKIKLMQKDFLAHTGQALHVFETWRPHYRQNFLYEQGRTRAGKQVTQVRGWQSFHQYGLACDFIVDQDPKQEGIQRPYDAGVDWPYLGELAKKYDLEWGGFWKIKDLSHVQVKTDLKAFDLLAVERNSGLLEVWKQIRI